MIKTVKRALIPSIILMCSISINNVEAKGESIKEVDLTINGESKTFETYAKTVEEILENIGYNHLTSDKINYELEDKVVDEMAIVLNSEKEITLTKYGETIDIKTNASTVGDILSEKGIVIKQNDIVIPSQETKVSNEDEIMIISYQEELYTKNETINNKRKVKYSFDVPYGDEIIEEKGQKGLTKHIYKKTYRNDIIISDEKIKEEVIKKPKNKEVIVGTKEIVENEIIFETITQNDNSMFEGESEIIQTGFNGIEEIIYENDGKERVLISKDVIKKPINEIIKKGTKKKPSIQSNSKYTLSQFQFNGVVHDNGRKFTYYSQSVLPGGGLRIPGRHVSPAGYVSDKDGYIVIASNRSIPKGTVIDTPFGSKGKVYDICASCDSKWFDVYTK